MTEDDTAPSQALRLNITELTAKLLSLPPGSYSLEDIASRTRGTRDAARMEALLRTPLSQLHTLPEEERALVQEILRVAAAHHAVREGA